MGASRFYFADAAVEGYFQEIVGTGEIGQLSMEGSRRCRFAEFRLIRFWWIGLSNEEDSPTEMCEQRAVAMPSVGGVKQP